MTFSLSTNGRFLIFNAVNGDGIFCSEHEYRANAPDAIYKYDMKLKQLDKLTPNDLFCDEYTIIRDTIYFTGRNNCNQHQPNIYKMDLNGKTITEFIKHANSVSLPR